jgi:hypothetical protein
MAEEMERLRVGDRVFIKTWNTYGVVTNAKPADFADDEIYEVQSKPHYFRRSHLEPEAKPQERAERKRRRAEKEARVHKIQMKVHELMSQKRGIGADLIIEFLQAQSEWLEELGYGPTLVDQDMTPRVQPSRTQSK